MAILNGSATSAPPPAITCPGDMTVACQAPTNVTVTDSVTEALRFYRFYYLATPK